MAEGKLYWIKLKFNMLTSKTVDFLMSQKGGANYVILYQMLCLLTINSNGELADYIGEYVIPFDEAKIQRDTKYFSIDTIRVALELYKKLGLVYVQENGILKIADFENLVGSESKWAGYKRKERLDNVQLLSNDKSNESPLRDKSIDIRDIDNRYVDINSIINNTSAEQSEDSSTVFIKLPLNTGENYSIYESDIDKYKELYPAVDVKQELRNMLGWLESNPKNRKTKNGIKSFITRWLNKKQDQAGRVDLTKTKYKTNGFESIDDNYGKSKSDYNPGEFDTL